MKGNILSIILLLTGWKSGKMTLKPGPDLVGKVWEVWKTNMAFD